MISHVGHLGVDVGAEVAEGHERVGLRVIFESDAGDRCFMRDEYFVLRHLSEADD